MIFVDSSVWINYFNGNVTKETDKLDSLFSTQLIIMGDLILTEVLQGFRNDKDYTIAKKIMSSLPVFAMLNTELAIKSADNFRLLRKKGITVNKTIDTIIATFCIQNNFPLLHNDRDFEPFHTHLHLKNAL